MAEMTVGQIEEVVAVVENLADAVELFLDGPKSPEECHLMCDYVKAAAVRLLSTAVVE